MIALNAHMDRYIGSERLGQHAAPQGAEGTVRLSLAALLPQRSDLKSRRKSTRNEQDAWHDTVSKAALHDPDVLSIKSHRAHDAPARSQ